MDALSFFEKRCCLYNGLGAGMEIIMDFCELEKNIQYKFKNIHLLKTAMCHSSYANEHRLGHFGCNERLEFLGDSLLGMITAEYLYRINPPFTEGDMTKMRAAYVCEGALCNYAREISLGSFLLLGRGEDMTGGRERDSLLADAFEALLAAMFLDSDIRQVKKFLLPFLERHSVSDSGIDYKTALQEKIQQSPNDEICYTLCAQSGPDHDKRFSVSVSLNGRIIGQGEGRSKKEAEQMAAKQALSADE